MYPESGRIIVNMCLDTGKYDISRYYIRCTLSLIRLIVIYFLLALNNFIMVDPRARYDLASTWIYQEFLAEEAYREKVEQEFLEGEDLSEEQMLVNNSYNESLLTLLHGFKERLDTKDK